jgi:hypothetical protein
MRNASFAIVEMKKQAITTYHHRTLLHVPKIARDVIFTSLVMAFLAAISQKVSFAVEFMKNQDIIIHHLQILLILCSKSS